MSTHNQPSTNTESVQEIQIEWEGRQIAITYCPEWTSNEETGFVLAHLEVRTDSPKIKLPITATGYRSYFFHPDEIIAHGGIKNYVLNWLDSASQNPRWQKTLLSDLQPSLF